MYSSTKISILAGAFTKVAFFDLAENYIVLTQHLIR